MNFLINFVNLIKGREDLQKILKNTLWLSYDRLFRMGFALVVGALMARYLQPHLYGIYNYSLSFVSLFAVLGTLGLDDIVIREMLKSPGRENVLLGTAFLLKLAGGFLIIIFSVFAINVSRPGDSLTNALVAIFSLGFVFQSFNVIDLFFQSRIKSKYTVIANNIAFILSSAARLTCIFLKAPVIIFAWLFIAEIIISTVGLLVFYNRNVRKIKWIYNSGAALDLLRDSWPLILSGAAIMVYMRIDQIMIGNMLGDVEVGLYSAAVRIAEVWYFVPMAVAGSIFPSIIDAKKKSRELYYSRLQKLYDLMVYLGVGIAVFFTIFSKEIILLLYGASYVKAAVALKIYIWAGVFVFLGVASSKYLISENYTKISFFRTFIGMVLNVALNLYMIPHFGLNGAALATLISYFAATFSSVLFLSTCKNSVLMIKSLFFVNVFKGLMKHVLFL